MAGNKDVERGEATPADEMAQPLIDRVKVADGECDGAHNNKDAESVTMVFVSTAVAVCGSFEFGASVGFSSPTQENITNDLGLSVAQFSVFGSIVTIGAMIGAVTSGRIADIIGRKGAMRMSAIFCILGWLAIYLSEGALMLDIGRFCNGYGIGVLSYVVPVFIAEITPKNLRGGLTTANQLFICTGVATAFVVGTLVSWRTLTLVGLMPCFLLLGGLFIIPESPRWLAKAGREKDFEIALRKLRGKDADVTEEASEILDYIQTLQTLPKTRMQDLFQRRYIHSVIVGVGLMVFQQLLGINGVIYYGRKTFVDAGCSGKVGSIAMGLIQIPITIVGAFLMDKTGRRPLLMTSAAGTCIGNFLAGMSFFLKDHGLLLDWVPTLAITGVLVFLGSFSIGMGAVPWVMMSEIFPINIKGTAGSLVTMVNWFGSWAISYTFNFLMSWSSSGTFFFYAGASAATILFVLKLVPETKKRTLEEIQASMKW